MTHPLLSRQLQRFLPEGAADEIPGWHAFIHAIGAAYSAADEEREMVERALRLMSIELRDRHSEVLLQLRAKSCVEDQLLEINEQLRSAVTQLENTQMQLLQADKMASVGQLAAGVAHEINNPIAYVGSNLSTLQKYLNDIIGLLQLVDEEKAACARVVREKIQTRQDAIDYDYLMADLPVLMLHTNDGIARVKKIVQDLRDFSHADSGEMAVEDIHRGICSTLNIVKNEYKNKADIIYELGELPLVQCNLGQLNQVFLNIVVNACHAIQGHGEIRISSGCQDNQVWVKIADTGAGIAPEHLARIFDAFYTTKPVGQGTGLGLSLSYSIIKAHQGHIEVSSVVGQGSTFTIWLPVVQAKPEPDNALAGNPPDLG